MPREDPRAGPEEIAAIFAAAASAAADGDEARFHSHLSKHGNSLREYLQGFIVDGTTAEFSARYVDDAWQRFLHTLSLVPLPAPARILEVGSNPYFFHLLLHKLFPASAIEGANFFERDIFSMRQDSFVQATRNEATGEVFEFSSRLFNLEASASYPYPKARFDLIFFCETLEHLVVDPLASFRRLKRILRPGGCLLITLPNAVRLANFALMLHGLNFFDLYQGHNGVHGRHNREFTLEEVRHLLQQDGFEVLRSETHDRYDYDRVSISSMDYAGPTIVVPEKRPQLLAILEQVGGTLENRGDNLYLLARKPAASEVRSLRQAPEDAPADGPLDAAALAGWESAQLALGVDRWEDSGPTLAITGWAFRRDGDSLRQSTHLILESPTAAYAFRTAPMWREDVTDTYGLQWDDPGFHLELDKSLLAPGRYRVGLLVHGSGHQPAFQRLSLETAV